MIDANTEKSRSTDRKYLASLIMMQELGGDINTAIAQTEATMEKEDVESVRNVLDEWRKNRKQS